MWGDDVFGSRLDLALVLERVASEARKLGGTPSAIHRAAKSAVPKTGFTWSYRDGTATIRTMSGRNGYVQSRQSNQGGLYRHVVEVHADREHEAVLPHAPLPWRLLPPGEYPFERVLESVKANGNAGNKDELDNTRLGIISGLGPAEKYKGVDQFKGYVAFYFPQARTAVLECPKLGNAIYVIRGEEWRSLSRLTKKELLREHPGVKRIIHIGRWLNRLKELLDADSG